MTDQTRVTAWEANRAVFFVQPHGLTQHNILPSDQSKPDRVRSPAGQLSVSVVALLSTEGSGDEILVCTPDWSPNSTITLPHPPKCGDRVHVPQVWTRAEVLTIQK